MHPWSWNFVFLTNVLSTFLNILFSPVSGSRMLSLRSPQRRRSVCLKSKPSSWACTWRRYSWSTRYGICVYGQLLMRLWGPGSSFGFCLSGSPPAAVWRCGSDEALRQGHHQRQPADLPAQQEVLWKVEEKRPLKTQNPCEGGSEAWTCRPTHLLHFLVAYANLQALFLLGWSQHCTCSVFL